MNRPTSISDQLKQDMEDCAISIRRMKAIGAQLAENADRLRLLLRELDERLISLHEKMPRDSRLTTEIGRLRVRIQRLEELKNIMELESFQITIDRAMQEAWNQLP